MSFGGAAVDERRVTQEHPTLSMVTGLLGNALGWDHRNSAALDELQQNLRLAARCDRSGVLLRDFHTVDLGAPFMRAGGWTTRGAVESRGGGSAKEGTHIRERFFLADAVYTVALGLRHARSAVTVSELERSLRSPARPLFLGRKCCLPSSPIFLASVEARSLRDALAQGHAIAKGRCRDAREAMSAWWPDDDDDTEGILISVVDERDWGNGIHVGRRLLRQGAVLVRKEGSHE